METDEERAEYVFNEAGGWVSTGGIEEKRAILKHAALRMLDDTARRQISISLSEGDLARLKTKAAERGVHYETLIDTILHEYAKG
ncbi:DNA-binding protein [Jiella avicenniae]|uniref:DNA-binding protein n=1 Tax=Jiella avicenniae TaxID=2907202 RepID=UPI001F18727E|nr:DNA-binding protein [Jiella avicenniae]